MNATAAKIVLQDIKVFAVDTHTETEFSQTKTDQTEPMTAKTIALLVTPQQAVILHAASEMGGSVRLVLRNPDDNVHVALRRRDDRRHFWPGPCHRIATRSKGRGKGKEDRPDRLAQRAEGERPLLRMPPAAPSRKMIVMLGGQLIAGRHSRRWRACRSNQPQQSSAGAGDDIEQPNRSDSTATGLDERQRRRCTGSGGTRTEPGRTVGGNNRESECVGCSRSDDDPLLELTKCSAERY